MTARHTRYAAVAVALTAAAALTAGCSSGGSDDEARKKSAERTASAAPSPDPGEGKGEPDRDTTTDGPGKKGEQDEAGKGATVPEAELTPATGTFGKKQKAYLVDRVPRGTDPAAILEAGQAACQRIGRTADADRKAAISALKSGEIANAEPAVRHLCPKYEPLLKEAGIGD